VTARTSAPPTVTLVAPASEAAENVRMPAGDRAGPPPLRRSRSAPIRSPMPKAIVRFRSKEARLGIVFPFARSSPRARPFVVTNSQTTPRKTGDDQCSGGCRPFRLIQIIAANPKSWKLSMTAPIRRGLRATSSQILRRIASCHQPFCRSGSTRNAFGSSDAVALVALGSSVAADSECNSGARPTRWRRTRHNRPISTAESSTERPL